MWRTSRKGGSNPGFKSDQSIQETGRNVFSCIVCNVHPEYYLISSPELHNGCYSQGKNVLIIKPNAPNCLLS